MQLLDSRRLTGPNLLTDRAAAVIDIALAADECEPLIAGWREHARATVAALGWHDEELFVRRYDGGASLAFSAPIDALYAATEINEHAWAAAVATLRGDAVEHDAAIDRLRTEIANERNPRLLALRGAAAAHGVTFLSDDAVASVGSGTGVHCWPVDDLPDPDAIDWRAVHDVGIAMVTGTNGKSTTARLLAAIATAAGQTAGLSTTDWIRVGDEIVDRGDYSGPGGARAVLRNRRTEFAVLETARGGMLRRGLGCERADAAAVLNVAADHLGEWGVGDLATLVETKFVVRRAIRYDGHLVLNADDPAVLARGRRAAEPVLWFTLDADHPEVGSHLRRGGRACVLAGGEICDAQGAERRTITAVTDVGIAFGGAARYNVANALAAAGLARASGFDLPAIATGLRAFGRTAADNPGRGNLLEFGTLRVLCDFAHNAHGLDALLEFAATLGGERKLILLGSAGDRSPENNRELVESIWRARPDRIMIKEMVPYLRGAAIGEIPALLERELLRAGTPADRIAHAPSELEAVRQSLAWARDGDLLLLLLHAERDAVMQLLGNAQAGGWRPGEPLAASMLDD